MILKIDRFFAAVLCAGVLIVGFIAGVCTDIITVSAVESTVPLPVVMYHKFSKSSSRVGKYTVSTEQFENDLKFLKERGYETVTVKDILAYTHGDADLPKKPVMITIDDGFETVYSYVLPLLKKYDYTAVAFIIGSVTDLYTETDDHNLKYSCLNWDEVKKLVEDGRIEIQSHSYDLHKISSGRSGAKKKKGESVAEYEVFLTEDLMKMQRLMQENTGFTPTAFAYPYGSFSPESKEIIKKLGFRAAFICEERVNKASRDNPQWLYSIGRYNRSGNLSSKTFFAKMGIE